MFKKKTKRWLPGDGGGEEIRLMVFKGTNFYQVVNVTEI